MEEKKRVRDDTQKRILYARINRIVGQLNGIKKMIENDRYCNDILIQLSSIESSVRSLSGSVLEDHIRHCVVHDLKEGHDETVDELIRLLGRFL